MSTPKEQAAIARINPSGTIKTSLSIYMPVLAGGLLLFEVVRRRFRQAYDGRGTDGSAFWASAARSHADSLFGWIPTVFRATDDEIFDRCGLDTLCYLRFLRMGQRVALVAITLSAVLFPLYATATPPKTTRIKVDPLERITMSNLAVRDWRLWASTAASYVITLFTLYLLVHEYRHYVKRRHELLSKPEAAMYTVLMDDLPLKLRTRQTLEQYMRKVFPDSLHSVYVAVECERLEDLVGEREKTRNALEHALAVAEKKGGFVSSRPRHREGGSWVGMLGCKAGSRGEIVDSIEFYQDRLAKLNSIVAREIRSLEDAQALLASQVEQQEHGDVKPPPTMTPEEEQALVARIDANLDGGQVRERRGSRMSRTGRSSSSSPSKVRPQQVAIDVGSGSNDQYFDIEGEGEDDNHDDDEHDETITIADGDKEAEMDARERKRRLRPIRVMRRAAFISFTSLMSSQVAQQALQASNPVAMATTPAPHLDDVNWSNVGHRYRTRAMGRLVASLITAAIVIFWTIPTAFVTSLATVESLRKELPFLNDAFDKYPALEELFKQIAPLLLVILSALAPVVFGLLSGREGYASNTEVRASVFTKLAYFQLIQIFFVTVIVGTVLDSLKEIIDQPKTLISMLGRSMPQQSTFFMSYVMVRTGLSLMLELLRVVPLLLALIFKICAPQLTRRERNSTWLGMGAVANTDPFDPTTQLADAFLVMLVTLTFSTIAPLVCYFTGFFFFAADLVYRRQVLFVYQPATHAMGAFWPRLYKFLIAALVVSQLTLLGLLSLKQAPSASVFVFALVIIILMSNHYVTALYPRAGKYLPLTQCVRLDEERTGGGKEASFRFMDDVYRQPAMSQGPPLRVDYQMLEEEFGHDGVVSSPEMHAEDKRLFGANSPL